ncbi:hypothetical protein QLX08_006256 [Tetragonisca angustula]|uniref:Uncharacterized protein n=1 Tax=Tetragonisca angustula TaxID=166442 RepID=A0AAW0ZW23_9HYME
MQGVMCQGITHDCSLVRSTLSWGLQVQQCLLRRIHGCVIPSPGRSSTECSNYSVGSPGTRFSYAGVAPTRLEHMRRNHARMGWLATPQVPRRHSAAGGGAP